MKNNKQMQSFAFRVDIVHDILEKINETIFQKKTFSESSQLVMRKNMKAFSSRTLFFFLF